ncbi:hypothetical protein C8Q79DRAFT_533718 [Trametes meyenii]|nr:hypothetical protein C8Q79DRAFT_533718 [Trametes meyenii]
MRKGVPAWYSRLMRMHLNASQEFIRATVNIKRLKAVPRTTKSSERPGRGWPWRESPLLRRSSLYLGQTRLRSVLAGREHSKTRTARSIPKSNGQPSTPFMPSRLLDQQAYPPRHSLEIKHRREAQFTEKGRGYDLPERAGIQSYSPTYLENNLVCSAVFLPALALRVAVNPRLLSSRFARPLHVGAGRTAVTAHFGRVPWGREPRASTWHAGNGGLRAEHGFWGRSESSKITRLEVHVYAPHVCFISGLWIRYTETLRFHSPKGTHMQPVAHQASRRPMTKYRISLGSRSK